MSSNYPFDYSSIKNSLIFIERDDESGKQNEITNAGHYLLCLGCAALRFTQSKLSLTERFQFVVFLFFGDGNSFVFPRGRKVAKKKRRNKAGSILYYSNGNASRVFQLRYCLCARDQRAAMIFPRHSKTDGGLVRCHSAVMTERTASMSR